MKPTTMCHITLDSTSKHLCQECYQDFAKGGEGLKIKNFATSFW